MNLIYVVILGLALFFAMQLINRIASLISGENKWVMLLRRTLPLVELIVWLAFAFWAASIIFPDYTFRRLVIGAMTIVLVLALGWYVFRDFLNGILLKTESALKTGQTIKTSFVSGKIISIGYRTLQLETDKGERLRVPYSRLSDAIVIQPPQKGQSHTHMFNFFLKDGSKAQQVTEKVYRELVNMTWVISENEPGVNLVHNESGEISLEVKFTVMKEEHAILVGRKLETLLSKAEE